MNIIKIIKNKLYFFYKELKNPVLKKIIYKLVKGKPKRTRFPFPLTIDGKRHYLLRKSYLNYYTLFYNPYQTSNFLNKDIVNIAELYETETIPCFDSKIGQIIVKNDSLIPFAILNHKCLTENNNKFSIEVSFNKKKYTLKNLPQNKFHYFKIKPCTNLKIKSKNKIIIGKPIDVSKEKKELVLTLFIDSLNQTIINKYQLKNLMPNSYEFFKKGEIYDKCHSSAEHTFSSVPCILSGKYLSNLKTPHNPRIKRNFKNLKFMQEYYKENGYTTISISGNGGLNSSEGINKGFDRSIYQNSMSANKIIDYALENLNTFKNRKIFLSISLLDMHHDLELLPSLNVMSKLKINEHSRAIPDFVTSSKSPFSPFSQNAESRYVLKLKELDLKIKRIYDHINLNYSDNHLVCLYSDHGNAEVQEKSRHLIDFYKTNIPLFITGKNCKPKISSQLISNVDILPTLLLKSDIAYDEESFNGKCIGSLREYVISESIFPGQTYKLSIKNLNYQYFYESQDLVDKSSYFNLDSGYKEIIMDYNNNDIKNTKLQNMFYKIAQSYIENYVNK